MPPGTLACTFVASPTDLTEPIRTGDRSALARGITLIESSRPEHGVLAEQLLNALLPHTGGSVRVGITGAPGVGKSTLIEALGLRLCQQHKRLAVLAVDPSSSISGGSILGDKTRMDELSRHPSAFIRPSPGGGTLGGVASKTQEAMLLCEAAGHDVVLVETIGTGQSEVAVHSMVDFFLVLLSPAAGDELQGIKRGVMELADGVLVHKADGDLLPAAQRTAQQCRLGMSVLHPGHAEAPTVLIGSSIDGTGLDELWQTIAAQLTNSQASGAFAQRRTKQAVEWLDRTVREALLHDFLSIESIAPALAAAQKRVAAGEQVATAAARGLLRLARRQP